METKLSQLKKLMAAGEWDKAIKFAAKFPQLGTQKRAITTAASAMLNPAFYRQMGKDPAELIGAGKAALIDRYGA